MSSEALKQAIEDGDKELSGRETKRNIAWFVIALMLFGTPLYLFLNAPDSVYQTSYAAIALIWFMTATVASNFIAGAMFAGRTVELQLQLEIAKAIQKSSNS